MNGNFNPSLDLQCLILVKKLNDISYLNIKNELLNYQKCVDSLTSQFYLKIEFYQIKSNYDYWYQILKKRDYVYDEYFKPTISEIFINIQNESETQNLNINDDFYEGFNINF